MIISYGFIHYLVCRKGRLNTLMIFTTTISVNNIQGVPGGMCETSGEFSSC
jgi:hypothetical protein